MAETDLIAKVGNALRQEKLTVEQACDIVGAAMPTSTGNEHYQVFQTLAENDLKSQNAMFDYIKAMGDDFYVDPKEDMGEFEQVASVFDSKLMEFN